MAGRRKRKLGRKHKHGAEVPTHALNDIMFFLLLFFLIITTVAPQDERKVDVPESNSSLQNTQKTITLTVTENKEFFFDNQPIKAEELEAKFAEVAEKEKESGKELGVSLAMDKKLQVSDILEVMLTAQKHKVRLYVKTIRKFS